MGVLVEDLLTLARLDEEPEGEREQVDLAALAGDAVDDARATAPDREIDLAVDGRRSRVLGEPDRLRQVLANLLRNALVHTPPGTPIEVSVTPHRRHARASRCATTGRGCRPTSPSSSSSASGAPRAVASAAAAAPASGWRSWRRSSTDTAARCPRATRPTAARGSS